jgi:hypothetical protein
MGAGRLSGQKKENPHLPVVRIVSLGDFSQAVAETAKSAAGEFVLIGGLAVGAWAQYFKVPTDGPVFSKDIDLRGSRLVAQALAKGMKRVTLVGISMGGLGALMHAAEYPRSADQRLLLSPFAGEEEVIDEIASGGGLRNWQPAETPAPRDYSRGLWRHFQQEKPRGLLLGCGEQDRLAPTSRLIAAELLNGHEALWIPGDHD